MDSTGEAGAVLVVVFVLLLGFALGLLNGALIVISRVPTSW